ncbi:MAG: SDR family NAD(P)-dependent oxidoreductase [Burkholderiaceae bacterium]
MSLKKVLAPGSVAVVTGAALGIGLAMCRELAASGVSVVLVDLPGADLNRALEEVKRASKDDQAKVVALATDVSRPEQVENLAGSVRRQFGSVNLLVNNAVTRIGRGMEAGIDQWRAAMDVNLWGPVSLVAAFLPAMLESDKRSFIVNVGSKQGITNPPGHPIYNMAKSALKTYTEALEHDLRNNPANQATGARVTAHLLVPGWTTTGNSEHKAGAWLPAEVVDRLFQALAHDDFYIICPDGEVTPEMDKKRILWGAQDMTENRPALSRWHPDYADAAKSVCG